MLLNRVGKEKLMSSKTKLKSFIEVNGVSYVVIALLTAIASEIKVIPFNGENFRFGLGNITFFLLILIRPSIPLIRTGLNYGNNGCLFPDNW